MMTTTAAAAADTKLNRTRRTRALCVLGGGLVAAIAWAVEVPH